MVVSIVFAKVIGGSAITRSTEDVSILVSSSSASPMKMSILLIRLDPSVLDGKSKPLLETIARVDEFLVKQLAKLPR